MLVQINDKVYKVSWCHTQFDAPQYLRPEYTNGVGECVPACHPIRGMSECRIEGLDNKKFVTSATAYCSTADVFSRVVGRKISFQRALNEAFYAGGASSTVEEALGTRRAFWAEYVKQCRLPAHNRRK